MPFSFSSQIWKACFSAANLTNVFVTLKPNWFKQSWCSSEHGSQMSVFPQPKDGPLSLNSQLLCGSTARDLKCKSKPEESSQDLFTCSTNEEIIEGKGDGFECEHLKRWVCALKSKNVLMVLDTDILKLKINIKIFADFWYVSTTDEMIRQKTLSKLERNCHLHALTSTPRGVFIINGIFCKVIK